MAAAMQRKYWVLVFAAIASAVFIGWRSWPSFMADHEFVDVSVRGFVADMGPVEIYLRNAQGAGTRLRIPAAFMQWSDDREVVSTTRLW